MTSGSETSTIVTPAIKALNGIPGVSAHRVHSGITRVRGGWMHHSKKGTPDIHVTVNGISVFMEAKKPGEKPTSAQRDMHLRLRKSGALVYTIESVHGALEIARRLLRMTVRVVDDGESTKANAPESECNRPGANHDKSGRTVRSIDE